MTRNEVRELAIKEVSNLINQRLTELDLNKVQRQINELSLVDFIERVYWEGAAIASRAIGKYYVFDEKIASQIEAPNL